MLIDLGLTDYEDSYRIQREFVARRKLGEVGDSLIVTEHKAVFTIGRMGETSNLLVDEKLLERDGIKFLRVDRGGDITFHGPGQIVIYPIIDLAPGAKDLHRYLRDLEEAAIRTLADYEISAQRSKGRTGVWSERGKIASVGVAARNWITYHGLSVNVNIDLRFFSMIHPCGIRDARVTSMKEILGKDVDMRGVTAALLTHFEDIFNLERYEFSKRNIPSLA